MLRLVAYAPNGVRRFSLDQDEMVVGSGDGCDIVLPYSGVAPRHVRLERRGDVVQVDDLGSRRGLVVNGDRVKHATLQVLDELRLGSIALLLEDVVQEEPTAPAAAPPPPLEPVIDSSRMLEHLAKVSQWVLADSASSTTLESLVVEMLLDFGGGVLFLFQGEEQGIKFVVASEAGWLSYGEELLEQVGRHPEAGPEEVTAFAGTLGGQRAWIFARKLWALERPYLFVMALPRFEPGDWSLRAALRTLGDHLILGLVHHVGQYEPILFGRRQRAGLTLDPDLVVGESPTMKRVLEQLRAAVDPPIDVLLRGETGVSKELLARSLHLSSRRQEGPFVSVRCEGASAQQLEVELFGARLEGKKEDLVREGQLLTADRGTLYLADVDHLPLTLQDRLMRFLRSEEVEITASGVPLSVEVRIITSSHRPLEAEAARDRFRIDLAYRLSQFVVDVPALRERREDLPLLIQAAVNRCCHQTGKRVQGITVKALEALAVHDYPGNLPELENLVRRLVYLCPPGRPIDESMLPEEIRLSKLKGPRPESRQDLDLDALVAETERAAIREALRRKDGNKSAAARLLGLSRNGLASKLKRLDLE
jgi:DNA-binding NtrC family response regulator/pSer/pThr/pTyr-binding forkhead associated (FHA) protein